MPLSPTEEGHRTGTPHWVIQAAKAEAYRGLLEYALNNHNMHVESFKRSYHGGGVPFEIPKKLKLVEEDE
jgi:hypothetical protein